MKKVDTSKRAVRTLLKQMVNILNTGDENSKRLWDILSALRGPDADNTYTLKKRTTARVRAVIGLKNGDRFIINSKLVPAEDVRFVLKNATNHFQNHYQTAVEAIKILYGYDLETEKKI